MTTLLGVSVDLAVVLAVALGATTVPRLTAPTSVVASLWL